MKITAIICCTVVLVIFLICEAFVTGNRDDNLHLERMEKIKKGIKDD